MDSPYFAVDSHCHLNMIAESENLARVITRAKNANVKYMQTICTSLDELQALLEITKEFPNVFSSVGVHPNEVDQESIALCEELVTLSAHHKIISFGETGLDYYREVTNKNSQTASFLEHIKAAQATNLPIIVHIRDAEEDTAQILSTQMQIQPFPGLIHCFTASKDFAKKMLDIGFYISFSGIITFKNADYLREIVKFIPLERILIETDAPYLSPVPMRGQINEPAFVTYIAEEIAKIKSIKLEDVLAVTTANFFTLFKKCAF